MLLHVVGSQTRRRHGRGAEGEARCQEQRKEHCRFERHWLVVEMFGIGI